MKVYRVTAEVEVEFLVAAEDEDEAQSVADECAEEAIADQRWCCPPYVSIAAEVADVAGIPRDWRNSIPYGEGAEDRTVEQILTAPEPEPAEVKDEWTIPMFPARGETKEG